MVERCDYCGSTKVKMRLIFDLGIEDMLLCNKCYRKRNEGVYNRPQHFTPVIREEKIDY